MERLVRHFPVLVLTGARQTGKTTLLRQLFPTHTYVSLDLPADAALAEEDPSEFLRHYPPPLLVDEVQYAPGLFRHIKVAVDRDRDMHGQFILSGSQKFTRMKEISDSLAGRCGVLELEGLTWAELGSTAERFVSATGFAALLSRGFMPQLWKDPQMLSAGFYRGYLATYLERDVRQILNELPRPADLARINELTALLDNSDQKHLIFCRAQPSFPIGDKGTAVNGMEIRAYL